MKGFENEIIKVNYDGEQPTVSARDLHEKLEIKTAFKDWFPRMCEYGFTVGKDFCSKMSESTGGRPESDCGFPNKLGKDFNMLKNERVQMGVAA